VNSGVLVFSAGALDFEVTGVTMLRKILPDGQDFASRRLNILNQAIHDDKIQFVTS
jgi:hypothetical protein